MGWICTKCGTENIFSCQFCLACRFEPDEVFLRKELEAANKEKAAAQKIIKRRNTALTQDYHTLRKCLLWLNAVSLIAVVIIFSLSALSEGIFTSTGTQSILAGDFTGHHGVCQLTNKGFFFLKRLNTSMIQLDIQNISHFATAQSLQVPSAAGNIGKVFASSSAQLRARSVYLLHCVKKSTEALKPLDSFLQILPQLVLQIFSSK